MPRLNGKFVSQETYDAAQAQTREENTVSDETTTEETAAVTTDNRYGTRPTTVLKRALNAKVNADVKLLKAQAKLDAYEQGGQKLRDAVAAAQAEVEDAEAAVEAAQEALTA